MKKVNRSISALLLVFCFIFTNTLTASADPKTDNLINTGEFLSLVINTLGYTKKSDKTFKDVPKGSAYEEAVSNAIAAGLLTHKEKSELKPDMFINKSTALSILAVALRADEERLKAALEIKSLTDERANLTKEFADNVIRELVGIKISGNSTEEKTIDAAHVTKKGAKISNLTANTLIIAPSVGGGDIIIENANIANLVILNDGVKNVTVIDSKIEQAVIANEGVSLNTEGDTEINKLTINAETVSLKSNVLGGLAGFKEISLEYRPSFDLTNGKADKSKQAILTAALKLEGEFSLIKVMDNINKLSILPQKESSNVKISKIQLDNTTNVFRVWYKATIASAGLTNGTKWKGNVTVEILNTSGITVRKDTVTKVNELTNKISELMENAKSANVDGEVFAGHDVSDKIVTYNTKIENLELPNKINFTSNQSKTVTGGVSWDYGKYDPNIPGKYIITGKISGTNVSWTPQTIDVTVTLEEMLTFTIPYIQVVIPKGTDEKKLLEELLPQKATATLSNGSTVTVKISDWKCVGNFDPNPTISTNYVFTGEVSRLPASAGRRGQVTATVVVQLDTNYPFK